MEDIFLTFNVLLMIVYVKDNDEDFHGKYFNKSLTTKMSKNIFSCQHISTYLIKNEERKLCQQLKREIVCAHHRRLEISREKIMAWNMRFDSK